MHRVYVSCGVYAVLGRVSLTPLLGCRCNGGGDPNSRGGVAGRGDGAQQSAFPPFVPLSILDA